MHVVNVRFQSQQGESLRDAAFFDESFAGHGPCGPQGFPFTCENLAPILWYPYEMIGDLVVRPAGLTGLQGIAHVDTIPAMERVRIVPLKGIRKRPSATIRVGQREDRTGLDGVPRYASCGQTGTRQMAESGCPAKSDQRAIRPALTVRANGDACFSGQCGYGAAITKPGPNGNPLPLQGQGLLSVDVARPGDASAG